MTALYSASDNDLNVKIVFELDLFMTKHVYLSETELTLLTEIVELLVKFVVVIVTFPNAEDSS